MGDRKLTVMFSTLNRSGALRETLREMARVQVPASWSAEFVVIDNGSTDGTRELLGDAEARMPLCTFRCSVPGKSNALNLGLERADLGELVVFTDDDVSPAADWLETIIAASERWPGHSVFGGRIDPAWPNDEPPPSWALASFIQSFAFTRHDHGALERVYAPQDTPFGPNYWVRREVLNGMKFAAHLGPRPKHRKLGQETEFLRRLRRKGYEPIYVPSARVEHRIESTRISKLAVYYRAFQLGQGMVHTHSFPNRAALARYAARWQLQRVLKLGRVVAQLPLLAIRRDEDARVLGIAESLARAGVELEALRLWAHLRRLKARRTTTPRTRSAQR
jgi:GT2 family glycosyltransferase